jgi:hypothetical protein
MIDAALRADIAARVRLERPVPGRRRASAAMIAREFEGRAPRAELTEAIKDARAAIKRGGELQDPRAPVLVEPQAMMNCTSKNLRLTRSGCFRLWRGAQEDEPSAWEGRAACVACMTGARNAGFYPSPVAQMVNDLRRTCTRCLHPASRLINGRFCISCYNRHCEALRGRNARGGRPKICGSLLSVEVAKLVGGEAISIIEHNVLGAFETMLSQARQALSPIGFGWAPRGPGHEADAS